MGSALKEGGSRHLDFEKMPTKKDCLTDTFTVWNALFVQQIGIIHWRAGWHQYVFQALPDVDMSRSCHREIDSFIDKLMDERKKVKETIVLNDFDLKVLEMKGEVNYAKYIVKLRGWKKSEKSGSVLPRGAKPQPRQ
jgi:hypothetical protein